MAEQLDKKEQRQWSKIRKKLKFDGGDSGLSDAQEKIIDKIVKRGVEATPKKDRQDDVQVLLPKKSEREEE